MGSLFMCSHASRRMRAGMLQFNVSCQQTAEQRRVLLNTVIKPSELNEIKFDVKIHLRCISCRFYKRVTDDMGECHGRPPSVTLMPGRMGNSLELHGIWPPVKGTDYCALHEFAVKGDS